MVPIMKQFDFSHNVFLWNLFFNPITLCTVFYRDYTIIEKYEHLKIVIISIQIIVQILMKKTAHKFFKPRG